MRSNDNSWFSDRTKTIIVTITMVILIGGIVLGYYSAYQWRQERREQIEQTEIIEQTKIIEIIEH